MKRLLTTGLRAAAAMLALMLLPAHADDTDLAFTMEITGSSGAPTLTVTNNSPLLSFNRMQMTIGNTAFNFDTRSVFSTTAPPGGEATQAQPPKGTQSDLLDIFLKGFSPGTSFSVNLDIDPDGRDDFADYRTTFFNNGGAANTKVTLFSGAKRIDFTLPDGSASQSRYTFKAPYRQLQVRSIAETGGSDYVRVVQLKVDGLSITTNIGELQSFSFPIGSQIEISAPRQVYKDINGVDITSSVENEPALIDQQAEERFTALGISVNDVPQTGDPALYRFELLEDTQVELRWQQDYALTIRSNFADTQSTTLVNGQPLAGPLTSQAAGSPSPAAQKHWVKRGEPGIAQIDGAVLDLLAQPGLDIRYVVKSYHAYGPSNSLTSPDIDGARLTYTLSNGTTVNGTDIRTPRSKDINGYAASGGLTVVTSTAHGLSDQASILITNSSESAYNREFTITFIDANSFSIPVGFTSDASVRGSWSETTFVKRFDFNSVETRQQVPQFSMWGPAGVTFNWKLQYGVRVNVDDPTRRTLPRIRDEGNGTVAGMQEGVFWFDPGVHLSVQTLAQEPGTNGRSLNGWLNGDGFYFPGSATLNSLTGDVPSSVIPGGGAAWRPSVVDAGSTWRGLEIFDLQRPARVMWRYGTGAYAVNVTIGESLFQRNDSLAALFTRQPEPIDATSFTADPLISGATPAADEIVEWDAGAGQLYPLVPGTFTVRWRPGTGVAEPVDIYVTATLPNDTDRSIRGHYPHRAESPPVALDPDATDNFAFKARRFTTAGAVVDGANKFTASTAGFTTLLFTEIQREGRGQPREFLRVRVVHTKAWNDGLPAPVNVTVGQRITDAADLAGLGTGYVRNSTGSVRFNPFIYNVNKLDGLASKDVYDMNLLRANPGVLSVVNRASLPGPVFPVNEHPNAPDSQKLTVFWYDNPVRNDALLWPHLVRTYTASFPLLTDTNVDRIVIASQYGSESKADSTADAAHKTPAGEQITAPAVGTDIPAATTFDPSRLQAVQIYQQPETAAPGYNPNEEHALVAPSLRYADVSPRPPAIYALRANGDLNTTAGNGYTSKPFVLVQFFDTAIQDYRMKLYRIVLEDSSFGYTFAPALSGSVAATTLNGYGHVEMKAGEPVIPFYPLGVAIGAAPPAEIFGNNLTVILPGTTTGRKQLTYWEDHKGSSWAVSGGDRAWFTTSFYYPLAPDFYWPARKQVQPVKIEVQGAVNTPVVNADPNDGFSNPYTPKQGDAVAFLPAQAGGTFEQNLPKPLLYHAGWPDNPPVLKAGETLTYSGGENRADNPTRKIVKPDGTVQTVETPGLPQVLAFASAEVVFDSQNPDSDPDKWQTNWTGRVVQALEVRQWPLNISLLSTELQPAAGKTRVSQGKFIFNDLPASLQKRFRYDPIGQRLELQGVLNDRTIGSNDLTAAPPAVYVLEPNILNDSDVALLKALVVTDHKSDWDAAVEDLAETTLDPANASHASPAVNVAGLKEVNAKVVPARAFGPGLALVPNDGLLDPDNTTPAEGWITVVENNDPALGGSPITPHIIKVDRTKRYRGSIKTILSDNVFDENIVLRHTGDFGADAGELFFEWYYRPDDGSLNVPPPDLISAGTPNPWKLFPDPTGRQGRGRYEITLKGNPNAPETLLADTWWFCRYRHANDRNGANGAGSTISGSNWGPNSTAPAGTKKYDWAGAGNSDPFHDFDLDGIFDYRAQLAMGWIKRVLDAVNPYEARIRDFEGENPATNTTMISQFGPRFEGPVALNPAKDVIENVGLIELYETVLKRARDLSIDLSRPVSTPAVANALQLASTRLSDFYTLLGNEAYTDSLDPTIGYGAEPGNDLSGANPGYGSMAPAIFTFMNQQPDVIGEELGLLRGVDDYFARPVYNRLFWNFTKDQGEAAYATNYNISDVNFDGFIDEKDAMKLYPMGHGDAWGHYLTALRKQYDLLRHPNFNWVSRAESYNLQDVVITVDFYDERKFAAAAAAKAKAGTEIVNLTYRQKYVDDPDAQWQGYTDSNPDRAWGVDEWARRAGQGAYFDWVTANALLPSEHPNTTLEGVRKVDRAENADIAVISANLSAIQSTMDQSNRGQNPLGLSRNALVFDIDPTFLEVGSTAQIGTRAVQGLLHFDQIYERALKMMENAQAIWNNANEARNMLRAQGNSEIEFRNATFQEDLSYRNQLIQIFGKPYDGTIGSGKFYPAGYDGPDLALYMYVPTRQVNKSTVPGPSIGTDAINSGFAGFDSAGNLNNGDLYHAFSSDGGQDGTGGGTGAFENHITDVSSDVRSLFTATFSSASNLAYGNSTTSGLFAVNYTDLTTPKVSLTNFIDKMPVTAAGYTFQAPGDWGSRAAPGELQGLITQMLIQEAAIAEAVGAWDALSGQVVRTIRLINARLTSSGRIQTSREAFSRIRLGIEGIIKGLQTAKEIVSLAKESHYEVSATTASGIPVNLPTGGLAVSPGDALGPVRIVPKLTYVAALPFYKTGEAWLKIGQFIAETAITAAANEVELFQQREERDIQIKEWLKELEDLVGDEPIRRIQIFKEIQGLQALSNQYRAKLDEGMRLIDERAAFNKRVAAQTQRSRYGDMTFRVARNHALQTYRSQFDLAARYTWLAAKAYDYETNYDVSDPGSPQAILSDIVRARTIGLFNDQPRRGAGGLSEALATLKANYESQRGQLGLNTPQRETGKMSLRTQLMRILPKGSQQPQAGVPAGEFPAPGMDSDSVWSAELNKAKVADLWDVPEFRYYCRPFAPASDASGTHVPQPGLVIRFGSEIMAGKNFFGKPLNGGDQAFDPTNYTTKIVGVGVWFSDYLSSDVLNDLATAPRVYLVPVGSDIMRVPHSGNPDTVRVWNVLDQAIPVPLPALHSSINSARFIPLLDTLNGPSGEVRKFSSFRAYHNGEADIDFEELVTDSRLIGRSVWNTEWMLIVPGQALNADPEEGLKRFIDQVSDISIVFETYGLSGG